MEEQKLSILQRNKINYILRSGQPLPASTPPKKTAPTECFPGLDLMHTKMARRRTLDAIKAGGGYERTKYDHHLYGGHFHEALKFQPFCWLSLFWIIRYIPQKFEPSELKKVQLQEQMSGLKHDFSLEDDKNVQKESSQPNGDTIKVDPIDECKGQQRASIKCFTTLQSNICPCLFVFLCSTTWDTGAHGLVRGDGKTRWRP